MREVKEIKFTKATGPKFIARLAFNALGLWIAARLSDNIEYGDSLWVIFWAAVIFSLVNAVLKPVLILLTFPAIIITLGLFMLVINGTMVWLVSEIYGPFDVNTFGAAILAAIIIWIVNYGLSMFFASSKLEVETRRIDE